jgi:outer membrane lipoprotein-sorting protein
MISITDYLSHRWGDRRAGSLSLAVQKRRASPGCCLGRYNPSTMEALRHKGWPAILLILLTMLPSACTRFYAPPIQRDMAAERLVKRLKQTNAGLVRFKCVANLALASPKRPLQSFRTAMAGVLPDRLRIDLISPYGGSAGAIASDGKHFYIVMYRSHEYYKKRFGNGSLRRLIDVDITVGDLLDLMVGRIPIDDEWWPRLKPAEDNTGSELILRDRWGRTRQRIILDTDGRPARSTWFDSRQQMTFTAAFAGWQEIEGFVLPRKIDLTGKGGERVSVALRHYTVNAALNDRIFILPPLPA